MSLVFCENDESVCEETRSDLAVTKGTCAVIQKSCRVCGFPKQMDDQIGSQQ